jgi:ribosome recycling factor
MDQDIIQITSSKMHKALEVLHTDLATIRTGRATPSLVENIVVSVYGGSTKLKVMELATIVAQDNLTLLITPFDNSVINEISKGIQDANTGLSPAVDGQVIRIAIPQLTGERRDQLIHLMKQKLENGRIMIRQIRHEAMAEVKKDDSISEDEESRLEKEVQKLTDESTAKIDEMGKKKEEELLQI